MAPIAEIVAKAIEAVGGAEAWALLTARERIGADLYNAQQPWRRLADVPGVSIARLPVRHRSGRYDLRAAHEGAAAARLRAGPATASSGREYPHRQRMERDLDAVMALAPTQRDGRRLRKRYGKARGHLFTFLDHPEAGCGQ
jgi:hypothetical protein